MADGTTVKGLYALLDGTQVDADHRNEPINMDVFYVASNKCTECQGFHEKPQCAAICPVACCVVDDMYRETVDDLMEKKTRLHA